MPPVLLLMMLLNPDAGSNDGSFMNADEFESVCAEGSVSMSDKDAPTSTEVETSPIWRVNVKLMGTGLLISSGSDLLEKPLAVTTISYMFGGILLKRKVPLSSVMVLWV